MNTKVNWGAIFAGATLGLGSSLLLTYFAMARFASWNFPPAGNLTPVPALNGTDAAFAIIITMVSFSLAGAATTLLGRYQQSHIAILHSLAAFSVALLAAHFLARGAPFFGRPPFSFAVDGWVNLPAAQLAFPGRVPLIRVFSSIFSAVGCGVASFYAYRWQLANVYAKNDVTLEEYIDRIAS